MNIIDCCLNGEEVWINPVGGLGDILIASSVMKLVNEERPQVQFSVVKRSRFNNFFKGHPAVKAIGHPPEGARIFGTLHWQDGEFFDADVYTEQRPFQVLAKKFGLAMPANERLYYPQMQDVEVESIRGYFQNSCKKVMICVSSDCPRKQMHPTKWRQVVQLLNEEGIVCYQVGKDGDPYIPGCITLLGLTKVGQLAELMNSVDVIATSDNLVMHLAKAMNKKAVVLWGPTKKEVFGYSDHVHIDVSGECPDSDGCIASQSYTNDCAKSIDEKCMNKISVYEVADALKKFLNEEGA